jgi:Ca2+-binding RTX toxin-like protein
MATLTTKPDFSETYSAVTAKLLNSITASTIWDETSLQYYFGDDETLDLDSEFASDFLSTFTGTPDAVFAFATGARAAFTSIDAVSQIDFSETNDPTVADQVLVSTDNNSDSNIEGFFEFPGTSFHDENPTTDSWSLGAFNSALDYMLVGPETGGGEYANWTIFHEIGHSLGLKHTHKETNGLPPLATIGKYMDNEKYSVMSYNGASSGTAYGHVVSMMALDVAALQALYGAEDYATGDSTYSLLNAQGGGLDLTEGDVSIGRAYYCIWDSGGTDTIDYASSGQSVLINLNDATLDTSGVAAEVKSVISALKTSAFYKSMASALQQEIVDEWHHAGGFFSHVLTKASGAYKAIAGGFSIAHDAVIENATGGDVADLLIGNEGANILTGQGGNDTLLGSGGVDILIGGAGNDRLDGGKGVDTLTGDAGNDRFVFSNGYGADTITDFADGDIIDLKRLTDFTGYADLFNNKMAQSGDDVVITVGTDQLIIEGIDKADLSKADFLI